MQKRLIAGVKFDTAYHAVPGTGLKRAGITDSVGARIDRGASLVTNNEREFRRVPGLSVQNWLKF